MVLDFLFRCIELGIILAIGVPTILMAIMIVLGIICFTSDKLGELIEKNINRGDNN